MTQTQKNANLLNDVIQVARDSQSFYQDVATETKNPNLRNLYGRMASAKGELISSLSGKVRTLGEQPADSGSVAGSLRKGYADLRATLSSNDDKIYIGQLEETEDRVLAHLKEALEATDSADVRNSLTQHLSAARACHDEMRSLKQSMGA